MGAITSDPLFSTPAVPVRVIDGAYSISGNGHRLVAQPVPQVAINFNYGVLNTELMKTTTASGGTVTQAASMAVLQTGTNAAGSAQLESVGALRYLSGTPNHASFSTVFATPVAGSLQEAGLADLNDGYLLQMVGVTPTFTRRSGGVDTGFPRAGWYDRLDGTGPSRVKIDFTKLNVWKISFLWHGGGPIVLFVLDPGTRLYVSVCIVAYPNTAIVPSCLDPILPLHLRVLNQGNTTNVQMSCGSMSGYTDGHDGTGIIPTLGVRTGTNATATVTTENAVVSVKNKATNVYGGTNTNRTRVRLMSVSIQYAGAAGQTATFRIVKGTTLGGSPSFADIDANTSALQKDTAGTTLTGGRELFARKLNGGNSETFDMSQQNITINPGEVFTFSALATASAACFFATSWLELP